MKKPYRLQGSSKCAKAMQTTYLLFCQSSPPMPVQPVQAIHNPQGTLQGQASSGSPGVGSLFSSFPWTNPWDFSPNAPQTMPAENIVNAYGATSAPNSAAAPATEELLRQATAEIRRLRLSQQNANNLNRNGAGGRIIHAGGYGLPTYRMPPMPTYHPVANRDRQGQRATDGTLVCHYCRRAGHTWCNCRTRARDLNMPTVGRQGNQNSFSPRSRDQGSLYFNARGQGSYPEAPQGPMPAHPQNHSGGYNNQYNQNQNRAGYQGANNQNHNQNNDRNGNMRANGPL